MRPHWHMDSIPLSRLPKERPPAPAEFPAGHLDYPRPEPFHPGSGSLPEEHPLLPAEFPAEHLNHLRPEPFHPGSGFLPAEHPLLLAGFPADHLTHQRLASSPLWFLLGFAL